MSDFKQTKDLVSIITPCYNGGGYVHRLLDSVLGQDYPAIEMIVVDDGSTDKTKEVIESYIPKFEAKGYTLRYVYQENAGQAAAANNALKYVSGEYMIWPDSDDYFALASTISKFVDCFKKLSDDYGIVRCYANNVSDETNELLGVRKYNIKKEKIFEEYFTGKESIAVAGLTMIRMSAFDKANPQREIYTGDHPQNWQLFLPVAYQYKHYTIEEPLHNIVIRTSSHSHSTERPYSKHIAGFEGYLRILEHTIGNIDMPADEKKRYLTLARQHNAFEKLTYALNYYQKADSIRFSKEYTSNGGVLTMQKKVKIALLSIHPCMLRLFNLIKR